MRVTNQMISNSLVHTLNKQKYEIQKSQQNLGTGKKIQFPSDDPVAAASQLLLNSRVRELNQYGRNINESKDRLHLTDNQLARVTDVFQRIRELTVQGANGIYTEFELKDVIAKEINQHLNSLVDIANIKDATGRSLFGGSVIERDPFLAVYTHSGSSGVENANALVGVQYQGDIQALKREIERGEEMIIGTPGNRVFWGTNAAIQSNRDSSNFIAQGDQVFSIDGVKIKVSSGDTLNDIIDKINNAPIEVKASRGAQNDIILTGTTPHQIWLDDVEEGTVLQTLGLINGSDPQPPGNYNPSATVTGFSAFDLVIQLRDDFVNNDKALIGGRDLEAIDLAIENVLRHRAEIGARVNRLEQHEKRITWDESYVKELLAKNESIDVVETIMDLKWLENVHNYALQVGSKMIKPSLIDFLR
ncbi:MAG: flagellar hook-associated protein 3 [Spirochaetia bacterium]|nr:flagellar hook-associated protein 3 [Spirochaetia bacterium]